MLATGVMKQPRSTFCEVRVPKLNIRRDLRASGRAQQINPRLLCYLNEIVQERVLLQRSISSLSKLAAPELQHKLPL